MSQVLNEPLYRALTLACQKGPPSGLAGRRVFVLNRGKSMAGQYVSDPFAKDVYNARTRLDVVSYGETYKVCCPYCGDLRHRLYINHRYGTFDPVTKSKNRFLCHCFNESCEKRADFHSVLEARIDVLSNKLAVSQIPLPSVTSGEVSPVIELPASCMPIQELEHSHPAVVFLRNKGFNHKKLGNNFNIKWCPHHPNQLVRHRIIVPINMYGCCVGWQARYVDLTGSGDCSRLFCCTNPMCMHQWVYPGDVKPQVCPQCGSNQHTPSAVPKWYTSPGTKVGSSMLNFDVARAYDFVVVVEGPHDVFRVGTPTMPDTAGPAVCIFNHKIGQAQQQLMFNTWANRGPIFLMFDDDVFAKSIDQAIRLAPLCKHGITVVELPKNQDPADLPHTEVWELISAAAEKANFPKKYRWSTK